MSQQYSPAGFNLLPPVVKNLLIINGLFFLASWSLQYRGIDLGNLLGLHYIQSDLFSPYQFVSYMFLHANFSHVAMNMFALWMFGYLLENVWGSKRFLTYYMVTGIGAAIIQTLVNWWAFSSVDAAVHVYYQNANIQNFVNLMKAYPPHSDQLVSELNSFLSKWVDAPVSPENIQMSKDYVNQFWQDYISTPTVGASGAVYGILLAFGMMFPNMLVYVYFLFPVKAKWIVIIYGVLELYSGIANNPGDNVAHFAHLGGMIFGFFLILYWKKKTGLYT
ncbi:MAG: rhomboid family intramembrane serine protease [Bacteroidota bacterium]